MWLSRFLTLQGRKAVSPATTLMFLLIFMKVGCCTSSISKGVNTGNLW